MSNSKQNMALSTEGPYVDQEVTPSSTHQGNSNAQPRMQQQQQPSLYLDTSTPQHGLRAGAAALISMQQYPPSQSLGIRQAQEAYKQQILQTQAMSTIGLQDQSNVHIQQQPSPLAPRSSEPAVDSNGPRSDLNVDSDAAVTSIYHVPSFLVKLYEIVDNKAQDHIVSWTEPDGDGFTIKNTNAFSEQILPQYFKHNNFSSFIRQLNMYDFHKAKTRGTNYQVFKHPFFLQGQKNLLPQIKRKSNSNHPLRVQKRQGQRPVPSQHMNRLSDDASPTSQNKGGMKNDSPTQIENVNQQQMMLPSPSNSNRARNEKQQRKEEEQATQQSIKDMMMRSQGNLDLNKQLNVRSKFEQKQSFAPPGPQREQQNLQMVSPTGLSVSTATNKFQRLSAPNEMMMPSSVTGANKQQPTTPVVSKPQGFQASPVLPHLQLQNSHNKLMSSESEVISTLVQQQQQKSTSQVIGSSIHKSIFNPQAAADSQQPASPLLQKQKSNPLRNTQAQNFFQLKNQIVPIHAVPRLSGNVVANAMQQSHFRDLSPIGARSGRYHMDDDVPFGALYPAISSSSVANKGHQLVRTQSDTELPKYFDGSQISLPQPRHTTLSNTTILFQKNHGAPKLPYKNPCESQDGSQTVDFNKSLTHLLNMQWTKQAVARKPVEQTPLGALQLTGASFGENGPNHILHAYTTAAENDLSGRIEEERMNKARSSPSPAVSADRSPIAHSAGQNVDNQLIVPPKQCQSQSIGQITEDRLNLEGAQIKKTDRDSYNAKTQSKKTLCFAQVKHDLRQELQSKDSFSFADLAAKDDDHHGDGKNSEQNMLDSMRQGDAEMKTKLTSKFAEAKDQLDGLDSGDPSSSKSVSCSSSSNCMPEITVQSQQVRTNGDEQDKCMDDPEALRRSKHQLHYQKLKRIGNSLRERKGGNKKQELAIKKIKNQEKNSSSRSGRISAKNKDDPISDQVQIMRMEIGKISNRFETFIMNQSYSNSKLVQLEQEKLKMRLINEELLAQLIASEERAQMYEKLVTMVLQFFKSRRASVPTMPTSLGQGQSAQVQLPGQQIQDSILGSFIHTQMQQQMIGGTQTMQAIDEMRMQVMQSTNQPAVATQNGLGVQGDGLIGMDPEQTQAIKSLMSMLQNTQQQVEQLSTQVNQRQKQNRRKKASHMKVPDGSSRASQQTGSAGPQVVPNDANQKAQMPRSNSYINIDQQDDEENPIRLLNQAKVVSPAMDAGNKKEYKFIEPHFEMPRSALDVANSQMSRANMIEEILQAKRPSFANNSMHLPYISQTEASKRNSLNVCSEMTFLQKQNHMKKSSTNLHSILMNKDSFKDSFDVPTNNAIDKNRGADATMKDNTGETDRTNGKRHSGGLNFQANHGLNDFTIVQMSAQDDKGKKSDADKDQMQGRYAQPTGMLGKDQQQQILAANRRQSIGGVDPQTLQKRLAAEMRQIAAASRERRNQADCDMQQPSAQQEKFKINLHVDDTTYACKKLEQQIQEYERNQMSGVNNQQPQSGSLAPTKQQSNTARVDSSAHFNAQYRFLMNQEPAAARRASLAQLQHIENRLKLRGNMATTAAGSQKHSIPADVPDELVQLLGEDLELTPVVNVPARVQTGKNLNRVAQPPMNYHRNRLVSLPMNKLNEEQRRELAERFRRQRPASDNRDACGVDTPSKNSGGARLGASYQMSNCQSLWETVFSQTPKMNAMMTGVVQPQNANAAIKLPPHKQNSSYEIDIDN